MALLIRLALALVLYHVLLLVLPNVPTRLGHWLWLTLPSLVLIGALLSPGKGAYAWRPLLKGGKRPGPAAMCTLCVAALVLAFAGLWPASGLPLGIPGLLQALLLLTIIPLAEEAFFRGALLDLLRQRLGAPAALAIVSLMFGLLHMPQGWPVALAMTVLSVMLCLVVFSSGSVLWAVALHLGWNALAIIRPGPAQDERWQVAAVAVVLMVGLTVLGLKRKG